MTLQVSGPISLQDIQTEFGGSNPISINEYYGVDTGVPASGTISFDDFYGTSAADVIPDPFSFNDINEPFATNQHLSVTNQVTTSGHTGFSALITFIVNDPAGSFTTIDIVVDGVETASFGSGSTFAIGAGDTLQFHVNTTALSGSGTSTGTVNILNSSDSNTLLDSFNWTHEMGTGF